MESLEHERRTADKLMKEKKKKAEAKLQKKLRKKSEEQKKHEVNIFLIDSSGPHFLNEG